MKTKIAVIGAGSWGTTLAVLLANKGYDVHLWARSKKFCDDIKANNENKKYLPGIKFPTMTINPNLEDAVRNADIIISAVPSQAVRDITKKYSYFINKKSIIVSITKGFEEGTFKRMSEIIQEELPDSVKIVVLSGPNHAEEVSRKIPTATVIASKDKFALNYVKDVFSTQHFKIYALHDVIGVEVCGAVKNIVAIGTGICYGLGLGDNALGSIMTLGLSELSSLGKALGAKRATFYGIAGVGDLITTCISKHSRNRYVGEQISKGKTLDQIKDEMNGMVAEGVKTTKLVYDFSKSQQVNLPLTTQVYKVLYENKDLRAAIKDLISLI